MRQLAIPESNKMREQKTLYWEAPGLRFQL